ncbi:MAG: replicative DNA helicase [Solirubrobacterales bacterium]|nr:replicative DNA helicase [Solirubrobacterales bacterium]
MSEYPYDGPPPPDNVVQGVAPPHSIESEQGVLGAVLLSDRAMYSYVVESQLKADDFYRERHRVIFGAMVEMYRESEEIDVLTVTEHLRARAQLEAAGGQAGIDELTAAVPAVGNMRRYGEIVKEMSLMRRLLTATYEIQASVHGRESLPREIVEQAERSMLEVAHDDSTKAFAPAGAIIEHELEIWHKLSTEGIAMTGTPSGFADLDTITGGFQPGNLIVLAARPSMGKCLTGETLVHDPRTGVRRRLDALVQDVEGGEEAWVTSLGGDLRLRPQRVRAVARNGRRPVFRVQTKLGRSITATANHPLLTVRGWKRVDELQPGDGVAVPRTLPHTAEERTLPDAEVVLLAALIADGNLTQKTPRFTYGADSPVVETLEEAALSMGVRPSPQDASLTMCLSAGRGGPQNPVTAMCRRHGIWGSRSSDKFVPDEIFRLVDHQIARFLSILYACDGHVYASPRLRQIGYTTISHRLARDVQHLLLRFGVVAKVRVLRRPVYEGTATRAYEVLITGQTDIRRFVDEIGVLGKSAAMARAIAGLANVRSKTNVDTAPPEAWALVDAARGTRSWAEVNRAAGYPSTHNWHVGSRGLPRDRLALLAGVREAPKLDALVHSDIWWDEVLGIEPAGEAETFDIEVPDDHNFVADDIVVHNSALVTNIAENVALHPERPMPVALFSLEMSEGELAQRFVASQASVEGDDLRKGRMKDERKWKKVLEAASRYDRAPLFVDDSSDIGVLEIRAKARRLHQQMQTEYGGLGLIIIDYLQLMRADGRTDNRVEQVGQMSRGLKILARELDVPVIALSQLSRGVESRTDKRPMLSDLRESGAIEQDADLCVFIYRDEYYNPETTEAPGEGELIIAKHRNGSLGTVHLVFQGKYTRFRTLTREYE